MTDKRSSNGRVVGPGRWCGTSGGYSNHNCRCEPCTEAWRQRSNPLVARMRARRYADGLTARGTPRKRKAQQ